MWVSDILPSARVGWLDWSIGKIFRRLKLLLHFCYISDCLTCWTKRGVWGVKMCWNNWPWGNGRPGPGTVSFEHHLYRLPSTFRSLAILRKHIVANSRLADLLNKERLSCHRQARQFLVGGKWEARSRGKYYSSTRSFVCRLTCGYSQPAAGIGVSPV